MNLLGTSVAQTAAATTHAAQQVARARDRRQADQDRALRRVREAFEAHLRSLEESEQEQAAPRLHVDDRLPERSIADELYEQLQRQREHLLSVATDPATATASTDPSDRPIVSGDEPDLQRERLTRYRPLDLTV